MKKTSVTEGGGGGGGKKKKEGVRWGGRRNRMVGKKMIDGPRRLESLHRAPTSGDMAVGGCSPRLFDFHLVLEEAQTELQFPC